MRGERLFALDHLPTDRILAPVDLQAVKAEVKRRTGLLCVTNDEFADDDPAYQQNADGWPRILSRLKTLLETGKTFRPH